MDVATAAQSGGPVGSRVVGCARDGKAALAQELERWLAAQGVTVQKR